MFWILQNGDLFRVHQKRHDFWEAKLFLKHWIFSSKGAWLFHEEVEWGSLPNCYHAISKNYLLRMLKFCECRNKYAEETWSFFVLYPCLLSEVNMNTRYHLSIQLVSSFLGSPTKDQLDCTLLSPHFTIMKLL